MATAHVAIAWYGADQAGNSNTISTTNTHWNVFIAESVNGHAISPVFAVSQATDHSNTRADLNRRPAGKFRPQPWRLLPVARPIKRVAYRIIMPVRLSPTSRGKGGGRGHRHMASAQAPPRSPVAAL